MTDATGEAEWYKACPGRLDHDRGPRGGWKHHQLWWEAAGGLTGLVLWKDTVLNHILIGLLFV